MTIVILTPIPLEQMAVHAHLENLSEQIEGGVLFYKGDFVGKSHRFEIVTQQTGSGNEKVALAAEKAIQIFQPDIMFLIGIAGGVKDVQLGDVVVGTKAYGYEYYKETSDGPKVRPEVINYSQDLIAIAKSVANKGIWKSRLPDRSIEAKVFLGAIAAGNKVISSTKTELYQFLKNNFNDTLALEMEAIGFGQAMLHHPHIKAINIRGVSDLLDGKNTLHDIDNQPVAASLAAAFSFELIDNLNLKNFGLGKVSNENRAVTASSPVFSQEENMNPPKNEAKKNLFKLDSTLLKIALFSVTLFGFSISIEKCFEIQIWAPIKAGQKNDLEEDTSSKSIPINPKPHREVKQEEAIHQLETKKEVYLLSCISPDPELQRITKFQLTKLFNGINLTEKIETANRELRCHAQKKLIKSTAGIRPVIQVSFSLKIVQANLTEGSTKSFFDKNSDAFIIHDESKIPELFENWLNEILVDIPPLNE